MSSTSRPVFNVDFSNPDASYPCTVSYVLTQELVFFFFLTCLVPPGTLINLYVFLKKKNQSHSTKFFKHQFDKHEFNYQVFSGSLNPKVIVAHGCTL